MGRIGKWISSKIGDYILGVVESRYKYNTSQFHYGPSGDDAPPLPDDATALLEVDGSGNWISVAVLNKSQGAEPGERILFSRDSSGATKATIKLLKDGTIEINGNSDYAVSWTDLNMALQTLVTAINAALAVKLDGGGTAGTLTLDISSARVTGVKLP